MDQGPSSIARLPVQLLARVLQHISQQEVLQSCCLVSHLWHEASVLAIDSITVDHCLQDQATALGAYLTSNAAVAAITSIHVHGCPSRSPRVGLQLPTQQLPNLQELVLERLQVSRQQPTTPAAARAGQSPAPAPAPAGPSMGESDTAAAAAGEAGAAPAPPSGQPDTAAAAAAGEGEAGAAATEDDSSSDGLLPPLLHPGLAALTYLDLEKCNVRLQGLPALTSLSHLSLSSPGPRDCEPRLVDRNKVVLVDALPALLRLTSLYLGGAYCAESALGQVSHLTRLLDLHCDDATCPASTLNGLPTSLTSLRLAFAAASTLPGPEDKQGPIISPSTTPRLCELTALRDLFVAQAKAFHVAILSSLTNLTSLSAGPLASAPGEPSLSVLTALTQLQLLELFDVHATQPAFVSLGDWAAVTASQALTRLDLSGVRVEFVGMVFPERRVLPQLVTLMGATVEWLLDRGLMRSMVAACPNLQEMELCSNGGLDDVEPAAWQRGLACLTGLSRLTSLKLDAMDMNMGAGVWGQLASLTGLHVLLLEHVDEPMTVGMLQLTALQQLTRLAGTVFQALPGGEAADDTGFAEFCLMSQAPPNGGATPSICSRLPQYVLQAVMARFDAFSSSPESVREVLRAALSLIDTTMSAQLMLQEQVNRLQESMKALVAGMRMVTERAMAEGASDGGAGGL